jgi:hypothetical protein
MIVVLQPLLFLLLYISLTTAAAAPVPPLNCTPSIFLDPTHLSSQEPICVAKVTQQPIVSLITTQTQTYSTVFNPNTLPSIPYDRQGKAIFASFLGGNTPSSPQLQQYLQGIAMVVVPTAVFLVLNTCCCFWCTCCHTCCKICNTKCCRPCKCLPRTTRAYTKQESCCPVLCWLLFALVMVAVALAGIVQGVFALNDAAVRSVCIVDDVYLRFSTFLNNVKTPLDKLNVGFAASVIDLKEAAIQDPSLSGNVRNIGAAFDVVKQQAINNQHNIPDGVLYKDTCDTVWDNLVEQCNEAKASILQEAKDIDQALIDVQTQIQTSVVDASDGATKALDAGAKTIGDTQTQVNTLLNPRTYGLITYSTLLRQNRNYGGVGAFGWVLLVVLLSSVAVSGMKCCRKLKYLEDEYRTNPGMQGYVLKVSVCCGRCAACCGCCSWWLVLLFGTLCSLLSLVFLPIAAVGGDACLVIPTLPQQMGELSGNPQISQITDTCWNKTGNLFYGLGLDQQIQLDGINFTAFKDKFSDDGVSIDATSVIELRTTLAGIDMNCYNNSNVTKNHTLFTVDYISSNITFAENAFNTNPSAGKLSLSGEQLINQVKCAIEEFIVGTGCYFIAQTWQDAVAVLCVDTIDAFLWIGTADLLLAGFAVPYAITMLCVMKRMGGHGPIKATRKTDDEDPDDIMNVKDRTVARRYHYVDEVKEEEEEDDGRDNVQVFTYEEEDSEEELDRDEILKWSKNRQVSRPDQAFF